ncbi:hypothetical protein C8A05DRAFT_16048 [Staphylotrichum tortipilum]|uniref:MYND-type domain-containing protein n=1 Tax=Staphylotrichum tortipilum TaxID=2831512 RepID=A0AAN6MKQ2_9PEZI|nr:hypothetical protein C8A05DRAFT_16048 [Staphylotrichum longicolle]
MATQRFPCANWTAGTVACTKPGRYSCKNCLLVLYCGQECQKSHWSAHKMDCKAPLGHKTWTPDWVQEKRQPAFVGDKPIVQFGGLKYLWGNVPAYDVLQLPSNEGENYKEPLRLLFAASGDLRNVLTTIAELPSSYSHPVEITMNDKDFDIVACNVIMLLIALVVDNTDVAVDCIIHIWYSSLIRKADLDILQQRIRPLIEEVCEKIRDKTPGSVLAKTWQFGQRSLRLVLQKSSWDNLLSFMNTPEGLSAKEANRIRRAVTLAESRKDYRDRHLLFQPPSRRIAKQRFREDGLLLPFGSRRDEFREPNPTIFHSTDAWPMPDNADPLNGWSTRQVEYCDTGPATADIYGKLFYHVNSVMRAFILRLSTLQAVFRLFQTDAAELVKSPNLEAGSFSRIEVSNITDGAYVGVHRTIFLMIPLLQTPLTNPHATLITLFMNVVDEYGMLPEEQMANWARTRAVMPRIVKYLSLKGIPDPLSLDMVRFIYAMGSVATYDHVLDRFAKEFRLSEAARSIGAAMKAKHTIIENWPFRLKLRPNQPGAQKEFDRLVSGGVSGKEFYVEWNRVE